MLIGMIMVYLPFVWVSAKNEDVIVVDGLWIDPLSETAEKCITAGLPELLMPGEARQISAMAAYYSRGPRPTTDELNQANEYLQRVDAYIQAGDWPKAFLEVRDALAISPNHLALLSRAAMLSLQMRQLDRADLYFERFLEQRPNDVHHIAGRVGALLGLARLKEAEEWIERGLKLDPGSLVLRFHQLCIHLIREVPLDDRGFWSRRPLEDLYRLSILLTDQRRELERMLGPKDFRELTVRVLGPVLSTQPAETRAALEKILQLRQNGQFKEARMAIEAFLRLGANNYGIRSAFADLLIREGWSAEGLRLWKALVEENKDWPQAWLSYGHQLLRNQQTTEAVAALREGLRLAPDEAVLRFVLACALARSGQIEEAQNLFGQLVLSHPMSVRAWMESDPMLERALRSVPQAPNYLRAMNIPPESE